MKIHQQLDGLYHIYMYIYIIINTSYKKWSKPPTSVSPQMGWISGIRCNSNGASRSQKSRQAKPEAPWKGRWMGWDEIYGIYDIWIYIYGINMEADDELIFYKYDAKATKYGDLLFFLEDAYYVCQQEVLEHWVECTLIEKDRRQVCDKLNYRIMLWILNLAQSY